MGGVCTVVFHEFMDDIFYGTEVRSVGILGYMSRERGSLRGADAG